MDKTALRTAAAKYGTPLYLFDLEAFTARAQRVRAAFGSDVNLCYSMKANPFVLRGLPDVFRWVEVCSRRADDLRKARHLAGAHPVLRCEQGRGRCRARRRAGGRSAHGREHAAL
ncbi:MAG: hypothetical protein ACLRRN_05430 [Oscillospiraceae bacterium]